jgi:hypothetical protein
MQDILRLQFHRGILMGVRVSFTAKRGFTSYYYKEVFSRQTKLSILTGKTGSTGSIPPWRDRRGLTGPEENFHDCQ